jgi:hypothetical protein
MATFSHKGRREESGRRNDRLETPFGLAKSADANATDPP